MWVGLTLRKPSCRPPCAGPPPPPPPPRRLCPRAAFVCPPTLNTNRYASTPDMRVLRCVSSRTRPSSSSQSSSSSSSVAVVAIVIVAVVLLLVTAVCKRACDRLSYAMLVTSSRRTLRYLVRERKKEHARMRMCTHAVDTGRPRFRARSIGTAIQIAPVFAMPEQDRIQDSWKCRRIAGDPPRLLPSFSPPLFGPRSGNGSANARDTRYMCTRRARSRPAGERACAGARESVRGRMRRVCVRARQTQHIFDRDRFSLRPPR